MAENKLADLSMDFALRAGREYGCTYQTKPWGARSPKASADIFAIGEIRRMLHFI